MGSGTIPPIAARLIRKLRKGCLIRKPYQVWDLTMDQKPKRFPIWTTLFVLGCLGLCGAVFAGTVKPKVWFDRWLGSRQKDFSNLVTKPVEQKQFQISLPVQGYIDSLGNSTLISAVEGTTTIISILPEGTMVQKDEVVCQLDSSALREKAQQQEITATQADSKALQAKETLDITITQNQSDIAAAQLKLDLANLDLPRLQFQASAWRHSQLPLWDPNHWAGQPFLGQVTGAAYPANWLHRPM